MRGAQDYGRYEFLLAGIIPADAGSTPLFNALYLYVTDHPRGCGEHLNFAVSKIQLVGSSPRMRGALLAVKVLIVQVGIIPADAGSTGWHICIIPGRGDHPRGCGEHYATPLSSFLALGSSPRMRGAH